ncbi:RHS domain-containing protein [Cronobacter dublinensis]
MYWYHNDVSGMPRELTGAGGEIAWRAEYRA